MDASFWHERWQNNEIAFHERQANALLVKHFPALSLAPGSRVFLPLCGKTLDIPWLLSQGHRAAGAELSRIAIDALFAEMNLQPEVAQSGGLAHFRAPNLDIFGGDIFALTGDVLGPVDAVYDRAALVALPEEMRRRYAAHLMEITHSAPQLLITYVYDQNGMKGPPFSVPDEEVKRLYQGSYHLTALSRLAVPGGLKGRVSAQETAWLLKPIHPRPATARNAGIKGKD